MVTGNVTDGWRLSERRRTSVGEVAYEVFGEGPPVILVHGTPLRSYLWRNVVPALAERHSVYVYDLLGYGESEKGKGQDVSIVAQARLLGELIEAWGLDVPAITGHDIGEVSCFEPTSLKRLALAASPSWMRWCWPRGCRSRGLLRGTSGNTREPTRLCRTTCSRRSSPPT